MLDNDDKSAITALLIRYERLWQSNDADKKLRAEIDARLKANSEQFTKLHAAFSIWGFDTSVIGGFKPIKEALGDEAYAKALAVARGQNTNPDLSKSEGGDEEVFALEESTVPETVREFVLDRLVSAGEKGAKATDIRQYIELARGTKLHDKTIGMTLYRLSLAGRARREGRTWFFVPEAKNPGAVTPGPINRDDKKGDEL